MKVSSVIGLVAAATMVLAGPCLAQERDWKALTRTDLDAAASLIRDNHPAMAPELGDRAFVARFDASLAKATARLDRVDSADGMAATLRGFASGLGDDHIAWGSKSGGQVKAWPGFVVARRGQDLAVTTTDASGPPAGAKLLDCDGVAARELLLQRLSDRVPDPTIDAQLIIGSIWVVLDDGNPFIPRPRVCRFDAGGRVIEHTLAYRPATPEDTKRIGAERRLTGQAGFGLRQVGEAWWISLQALNEAAPAVLEAARARQAELRAAPLVVIDLRGNGGGNSRYGDTLAITLLGEKPFAQSSGGEGRFCPPVWRASPGNRRQLDTYAARFPENAAVWRAETRRMDEALAAGRALTGPVEGCEVVEHKAPPPPHPLFRGKLVIITDAACFSSCPLMVKRFRALGALQVGAATNAPTRYMEVRALDLPSGLGFFTTMQKASVSSPPMIGPYAPDVPFPGDIADTAALEAWVPEVAG